MKSIGWIKHADGSVTLDKTRHLAALDAMWEAGALAQALIDQANSARASDEMGVEYPLAVRGMAARLLALVKVCAVALDDSVPDVGQLAEEHHLATAVKGQS
ncbi:hypothetical protein [Aquabacterium sp. A08]|uniref:hypothetical protein n=1 Tax=Aquabacterium sp. A08 TaxID=2718532 RepID=UPI00142452E4|nr:hypothetical protein [Aquabacterium sp. A08]NIC43111.1 hypothetical protein [Aquabacterium sp. A08]